MKSMRSFAIAAALAVVMGLAVSACGRESVAKAPAPETELFSRAPIGEAVPAISAAGISFQTSGPVDVAVGRATFGPGARTAGTFTPGRGSFR